jgi:hypothetical protein
MEGSVDYLSPSEMLLFVNDFSNDRGIMIFFSLHHLTYRFALYYFCRREVLQQTVLLF